MKHHVFLWSPTRPCNFIREADVEILVTGKRSWAVMPNGRRRLIGTSAFYTRPSAERAKLGALRKIAEDRVLARMFKTAPLFHSANTQLAEWKTTGKVH